MTSEVNNHQDYVAYFMLLVTMIIWGTSWPLGRVLVTNLSSLPDFLTGPPIPQFLLAFVRYTLVVPLFFLILWMREKSFGLDFARKHFPLLLVMGILSVPIYQAGYLFGETYTAASDASILIATSPIWVLLLSVIFLKKPVFPIKLLGVLLGFAGAVTIATLSPHTSFQDRMLGNALILMASMAYASYTVALHYLMDGYANGEPNKPSSLQVITWVSLFGFLSMFPLLPLLPPESLNIVYYSTIPKFWIGVLYLAFLSTIVAYLFYVESVFRLGANRAVIFVNFIPIVGVLLSGLFLPDEEIDLVIHSASFLLVLLGITLVNKKFGAERGIQAAAKASG